MSVQGQRPDLYQHGASPHDTGQTRSGGLKARPNRRHLSRLSTGTGETGLQDPKLVNALKRLEEHGELERVRLIVDWAEDRANHQLERGENESGRDSLERARLTYRDRAGKAKDPLMARRHVEAWEKVGVAVQGLSREMDG